MAATPTLTPHAEPSRRSSLRPLVLLVATIVVVLTACGSSESPLEAVAADETVEIEVVESQETEPDYEEGMGDGEEALSEDGPPEVIDIEQLTARRWMLQFGGGPDGEIVPVEGFPVSIMFRADGSFQAWSCNSYEDGYTIDGTQFRVARQGSVTEVLCEPESLNLVVDALIFALADVDGINLRADELVLSGPSTELIFGPGAEVPADRPSNEPEARLDDLWGRSFVLEALSTPLESAPVEGEGLILAVHPDNSFTVDTGCRTIAGQLEVSGPDVLINNVADVSSVGECDGSLAEQDRYVTAVFSESLILEFDSGGGRLKNADDLGLQYRETTGGAVVDVSDVEEG